MQGLAWRPHIGYRHPGQEGSGVTTIYIHIVPKSSLKIIVQIHNWSILVFKG